MLQWCAIAATVWITMGHHMFQKYVVVATAWVTVLMLVLLCASERVIAPHASCCVRLLVLLLHACGHVTAPIGAAAAMCMCAHETDRARVVPTDAWAWAAGRWQRGFFPWDA
jgi:hypothetical protein